ncbi:MAG TPA: hypothetical protein VFH88_04950, partial [Candidatus Krumholzibacteria bacterium]|nr:hypothetical protein [Candidatus Krumholzibacteria bacterium]
MLHIAFRFRVALAASALLLFSGCLFEPTPNQPGTLATGNSANPQDTLSQAAPLDPSSYTSKPVPTGKLADMLMMGGYLYEPYNNWWNVQVLNAPVDPNSAQIIATIQSYESTGGRLHPDFAANFGIPYAVVDQNTPLVPVSFANSRESDAGAPGLPTGYPIPAAATTDPSYIENGGSSDGDRHLLVFDRDHRIAFELAQASYSSGQWSASYGAVF